MDITDWSQSKYGFYVDRHWLTDHWLLKPGPIKLAPHHQIILSHIFTSTSSDGRLPYDIVCLCEPAKSGKSTIAALAALYAALHLDINSTIVMASNKQDQAISEMFRSLTDAVRYNPHLPNVDPNRSDVTFRNGNTVKAIASSSKSAAGSRFSLALFDELWGYESEDSQRLWAEFKTDPTRQASMRLAVGYCGYKGQSKLWQDLLTDGQSGQPVLTQITNADGQPACWRNGRTFVYWSHVCRQPWQTKSWQDEQRQVLRPADYDRMIQCQFSEPEFEQRPATPQQRLDYYNRLWFIWSGTSERERYILADLERLEQNTNDYLDGLQPGQLAYHHDLAYFADRRQLYADVLEKMT